MFEGKRIDIDEFLFYGIKQNKNGIRSLKYFNVIQPKKFENTLGIIYENEKKSFIYRVKEKEEKYYDIYLDRFEWEFKMNSKISD
jgi:hypothetical protein